MQTLFNKVNDANIRFRKTCEIEESMNTRIANLVSPIKKHLVWTSILLCVILYHTVMSLVESKLYYSLFPLLIFFLFRISQYLKKNNQFIIKEIFYPLKKQEQEIVNLFYNSNLIDDIFPTLYKNPYLHIFLERFTKAIEQKNLSFTQVEEAVSYVREHSHNSLFHNLVAKNSPKKNEIKFFQK